MNSGFAGADVVEACLDRPARRQRRAARFDHAMRHGPSEFSWFIYRVTKPTLRDLFMNPAHPVRAGGLLSLLAGDVFRDTPLRCGCSRSRLSTWPTMSSTRGSWLAWVRKHRMAVREA